MKVIYVVRTFLHMFPPCLNQIQYLRELGYDVVTIYGNCDENTENLLHSIGVETFNLEINRSTIKSVGKIQSYIDYKKRVLMALSNKYSEGDLIWYGTVDSCFSLGSEHKKYPFVLNVLELYDKNSFYEKGLRRVIKHAKAIVACEPTRAAIMKMWYNLDKRPYIMPNKPYKIPDINGEGTIKETQEIINMIKNKKVILYQGIIASDRNLGLLADALHEINDKDIYLGLMGKEINDSAIDLKKKYSQTIYLGYIPAPYHLEVTGNASIGVAYYKESSLNNLFCAPNKIYEYSGLGLPILCNDVPGLQNTVGAFRAGECIDFDNKKTLINAIKNIISNRSSYSQNSRELYDSVDNKQNIKKILFDIGVMDNENVL